MSKTEFDKKCRLLIIGDSQVGKTSFLSRYTKGVFNLTYLSTAGIEFFSKDEIINNRKIRIELWDTAGSEKFFSLTSNFLGNAQGIMVMFDVTNIDSFESLINWTDSIKTHLSNGIENIPVIIIGNKIDIKEREIKSIDANKYCNDLGFKYFETSAKTGENVRDTIIYLVKEVLKKNTDEKKNIGEKGNNEGKKTHRQNEGNCECVII